MAIAACSSHGAIGKKHTTKNERKAESNEVNVRPRRRWALLIIWQLNCCNKRLENCIFIRSSCIVHETNHWERRTSIFSISLLLYFIIYFAPFTFSLSLFLVFVSLMHPNTFLLLTVPPLIHLLNPNQSQPLNWPASFSHSDIQAKSATPSHKLYQEIYLHIHTESHMAHIHLVIIIIEHWNIIIKSWISPGFFKKWKQKQNTWHLL